MAITATAAVVGPGGNTSTVIIGQVCHLQLTITNNNSTAALVSDVSPYARATSSSNVLNEAAPNFGKVNLGPNSPYGMVTGNGGSLIVPVSVIFPQSSSSPIVPVPSVNSSTQNVSVNANNTYDVGATIHLVDANTSTTHIIVTPTATTVTVSTIPLPCSN